MRITSDPASGPTTASVQLDANVFMLDRPNDLAPETQAILFHWACRGCRVTPLLVPRYRRALAVANAPQRA